MLPSQSSSMPLQVASFAAPGRGVQLVCSWPRTQELTPEAAQAHDVARQAQDLRVTGEEG
jgi:hypothetical protein